MMNLKYYLRGLGIGIVVTALIMGIVAGTGKKEPSDAEIRKRAKELGMIEESTLLADVAVTDKKDLQENPVTESVDEPVAEPTAEPTVEPTAEPTAEPAAEPTAEPTAEPAAEPTAEPVAEPIAEPAEEPAAEPAEGSGSDSITITVNKGEGSYTICKRLEDAGLVSSASELDHYLCERGYDRRMRVGSFQIPAGADQEQIAGILAGF